MTETPPPGPSAPEVPATGAALHQARVERLRRDPLLASSKPAQLARLLGEVTAVTVAAGDTLYEAGARAGAMYLIDSGEVALHTSTGRSVSLQTPRCGEEAATDLKNYVTSATAVTEVAALRVPREALAELAQGSPGLASRAMLGLTSHLSGEALLPAPKPAAAKAPAAPTPSERKEIIGWGSVIVAPLVIYFAGSAAGLRLESAMFLAILSITVLMWLFGLAEEYVPALMAISAVLMVGLVPAHVALAGFSSNSLTTLVGVYALASLIAASGLSYRVMVWLLIRLPDTRFWQQMALLLSGYALAPIMPSGNARLTLLLPFYRDMTVSLGLKPQSATATALMASLFSGAMLFSPMFLTSKSSNLTVFTMLPVQVQDEFQGIFWLVAAGVAAITVTLVHLVAVRLSFAAEVQAPLPKSRLAVQLGLLGPVSAPEKAALLGFVLFVAGAATTPWHQVNPAWLAAFILVSLLLMGLVSKKDFQQKIDWPMIFFLLSLDGLSRSLTYLGLDQALANSVGGSLNFINGNLWLFIPVALVVTLALRLVLPITAGMVVSAVVLMPIAIGQNIHPWVAVFLTALFSDMWFRPYQSSQYLQVVSSGYTRFYAEPDFLRYNHVMNVSRILAAYASVPYWQWLGLA